MDYLCGRELRVENVSTTVTGNPEKKQKVWVTVVAIAAVLVVAIVGLWFVGRANRIAPADDREEPAAAYLPDTIEISGVQFVRFGKPHFECRFVSNVAGDQYDYQVHFKDLDGTVSSFDAELEGGFYSAMTDLPNGHYSVSITVSNGVESRANLLAGELTVKDNMFSWK